MPWPAVPDSDDPDTGSIIEPVSDDNGYVGRRSQESLLAGGNASEDARQHAAMLLAQLIAHFVQRGNGVTGGEVERGEGVRNLLWR